jgi:hypothetical protein
MGRRPGVNRSLLCAQSPARIGNPRVHTTDNFARGGTAVEAPNRLARLSPLSRGSPQGFAQSARRASLILHLLLREECDQSRTGNQQNKGDCNSNYNHLRFLCRGLFQGHCSSGPEFALSSRNP